MGSTARFDVGELLSVKEADRFLRDKRPWMSKRRSFRAAAVRSDRSYGMEDRLKSAREASKCHHKLTGWWYVVTVETIEEAMNGNKDFPETRERPYYHDEPITVAPPAPRRRSRSGAPPASRRHSRSVAPPPPAPPASSAPGPAPPAPSALFAPGPSPPVLPGLPTPYAPVTSAPAPCAPAPFAPFASAPAPCPPGPFAPVPYAPTLSAPGPSAPPAPAEGPYLFEQGSVRLSSDDLRLRFLAVSDSLTAPSNRQLSGRELAERHKEPVLGLLDFLWE